jgi:hypothetical protein
VAAARSRDGAERPRLIGIEAGWHRPLRAAGGGVAPRKRCANTIIRAGTTVGVARQLVAIISET